MALQEVDENCPTELRRDRAFPRVGPGKRRGGGFSFDAITACCLGAVEGLVGGSEQRLHNLLVGIEGSRYSHANGDLNGKVFERNGLEQTISRRRSAWISPSVFEHPGATTRNSSPPKRPTRS